MAERNRPDPYAPPRDSSATKRVSVPEPDDIGLPQAKRSYVLPLAIALAVFVLIILFRVIWG